MGKFRYRRSIKILPGVRLNLNKNGHSWTFGGKYGRTTINKKRGTVTNTRTVRLPIKGLSYSETTTTKIPTKETTKPKLPKQQMPPEKMVKFSQRWFIFFATMSILWAFLYWAIEGIIPLIFLTISLIMCVGYASTYQTNKKIVDSSQGTEQDTKQKAEQDDEHNENEVIVTSYEPEPTIEEDQQPSLEPQPVEPQQKNDSQADLKAARKGLFSKILLYISIFCTVVCLIGTEFEAAFFYGIIAAIIWLIRNRKKKQQ